MFRVHCPLYNRINRWASPLTRNLIQKMLGVERFKSYHSKHHLVTKTVFFKEKQQLYKKHWFWNSPTVAVVEVPAETSNSTCQSLCHCLTLSRWVPTSSRWQSIQRIECVSSAQPSILKHPLLTRITGTPATYWGCPRFFSSVQCFRSPVGKIDPWYENKLYLQIFCPSV